MKIPLPFLLTLLLLFGALLRSLFSNQLYGTIPTELGELDQLRYLYFHTNKLSGTIPTDLGKLGKLIELYLYTNQLNGTIPTELGKLDQLQYLALQSNGLSGTIPSILETLPSLDFLYLANNELCYWTDYSGWASDNDSGSNTACANCEVSCLNGGTCGKGNPSYVCTCPSEFPILPNCTAPETTTETTTSTESTTPTETTTATPTATPFVGCGAGNYDHANWPATGFGATATGTCLRGFGSVSFPTRRCLASSESWSSTIKNRCLTLKCPLDGEWPMTIAGRRATIPCNGGGPGEAHRWCGYDGQWIEPPVYYC